MEIILKRREKLKIWKNFTCLNIWARIVVLGTGLLLALSVAVFTTVKTGIFLPEIKLEVAAPSGFDRTIKVYGPSYYAPYSFLNSEGKPDGYQVELIYEICSRLGYNVDYQCFDKDILPEKLTLDEASVYTCLTTRYSGYNDNITFAKTTSTDRLTFFGKKNVKSIYSIDEEVIGVTEDTDSFRRSILHCKNVKVYSSTEEAFLALERGDIEYLFERRAIGLDYLSRHENSGITPAISDGEEFTLYLFMGISSNEPGLIQNIDETIGQLHSDEVLCRLQNKWLVDYYNHHTVLEVIRLNSKIYIQFAFLFIIYIYSVSIFLNFAEKQKRKSEEVQDKLRNNLNQALYSLEEKKDIIHSAEMGTWRIEFIEGAKPYMTGDDKMRQLLGMDGSNNSQEDMYEAWYSRIKPEDLDSVKNSVKKMIEGRRDENTYIWNHPVLGDRYVRCGGTAIRAGDMGFILRGYHYDVTEIVEKEMADQKALKEALLSAQQANAAKTMFLNNISHDIRTPMNAIIGFTSLAVTHADDPDKTREYLKKINTSSQHLLSLINDVLDMSRIESGKVKIEEQEVHLPSVIHDIRTILQSTVVIKNIELSIDTVNVVHEDIICDKLRLNQVLLNILSNSTKFTGSGGKISLRIIETPSARDGYADFQFQITDSGIGMSSEFLEHIFEPFEREQSSTQSKVPGTGLGMSITKKIVDLMGGDITVSSEAGKGSEFTVSVSFRTCGHHEETEKLESMLNVHALVADDDPNTAVSVSKILSDLGLRSEWTLSGKEAVLRSQVAMEGGDEFGVFLIDWQMPDMNGVETVRRIRRTLGSTKPIFILTAYDWKDIEDEAVEAGVTGFISKPLFMSELRKVLSSPYQMEKNNEDIIPNVDFLGKKILLAEDNKLNQEISEEILKEIGFKVDIADDGSIALQKVQTAPAGTYDLILMDVQMPNMNGYEATMAIRQLSDPEKAAIPIIAMTANAFEEDRQQALKAGMNAHIAKPIELKNMIDTLSRILGK